MSLDKFPTLDLGSLSLCETEFQLVNIHKGGCADQYTYKSDFSYASQH